MPPLTHLRRYPASASRAFRHLLVAACASLVVAISALAPEVQAQSSSEDAGAAIAASERAARLDTLFKELDRALDETEAAAITNRIWETWLRSGKVSRDAAMNRIVAAMGRRDLATAYDLSSELVREEPNDAEAWNKRATINFMLSRYDASLADIKRVLALEPRHFGALSGRALCLTEKGDKEGALAAIEAALQINPFLRGAKNIVERNGGTWRPRRPI
ncbi:MAG: tetratricopeptide repeat protein [Pseudomonadota bacterium]